MKGKKCREAGANAYSRWR